MFNTTQLCRNPLQLLTATKPSKPIKPSANPFAVEHAKHAIAALAKAEQTLGFKSDNPAATCRLIMALL